MYQSGYEVNRMSTTQPSRTERHEPDAAFIHYLRGLVEREELAALAALRCGLGKEPGTAPEMYPCVVPFLPRQPRAVQEIAYYLVAALFAWHQKDWPSDDRFTNLGASLAQLRWEQARERGETPEHGDSTERRFVALLTSTREDLPYHLRQMIGLLRTKEVPVNWLQLLFDIQRWDADSRIVQRRWASAFWGHAAPEQPSNTPPEATMSND
jgi:CRISPR system Cascade subunit CasB